MHHGGVGDGRSHVVEQNSSCPDQNVKAKRMFSYYGFQLSKANPRGPRDIPPAEGYRISLDCYSDAQAFGRELQHSHYSPFGLLSSLIVHTAGWGLTIVV